MSERPGFGAGKLANSELGSLRAVWICLLVVGTLLIILGIAVISTASSLDRTASATALMVTVFGIFMLVGGLFQVAGSFWGRTWKGVFLHLLGGILYLIAGLFMIERPLELATVATLLIAACLIVGGMLRIILSLAQRFDGWGWMILNGVISLLLGISIWRQWPISGLWVIGLFVGIEMLFSGMSWVMLGLAARSLTKATYSASS